MDRLTTPDGDYCHDVCKCVNSCRLLKEGRPLCSDVARYERLQMYENIEDQAEQISNSSNAFVKEAEACEAERLRLEKRINQIRAQMKTDHSQELRDKLAAYQQMAFEMKIKSRCFRRRAEERRQQS